MVVQIPNWFNSLEALEGYVTALEADIGSKKKDKYTQPFAIIKENLTALRNINAAVKANGGFLILNADGSPKIDSDASLQFISALDNAAVKNITTAIQSAAQQILIVSKKEFTRDNDKGIRLQGMMDLAVKIETAHTQEKFKRELAFFSAEFKTHPTAAVAMSETKDITWFDTDNLARIKDAIAILQKPLVNDPLQATIDLTPKIINDPERPEVASSIQHADPAQNALNIIKASIQNLEHINASVAEFGAYSVENRKNNFDLHFSEKRFDDTFINNMRGNIHQALSTLESHYEKGTPELAALSFIRDHAEPFREHNLKMNAVILDFYKEKYLEQHPAPVIDNLPPPPLNDDDLPPLPLPKNDESPPPPPLSPNGLNNDESVLKNPSPIIPERNQGFLNVKKIVKTEQALDKINWNLSSPKTENNETFRIAYDSTKTKQFIVTNTEMKTHGADLETFKAMLLCFEAQHKTLPLITTANQAIKDQWIAACQDLFPERKMDFDSMIAIKKLPTPATPAPSQTPDEPDNRPRMGH